jgi:rhodanese-related sulfurtransferase
MLRTTIDDLLAQARRQLRRLDPAGAFEAMRSGATLIDIRADSQIAADGVVVGALVIPRNVLEWRLDPASGHRHPQAPGLEDQVILMCNEGYASSLAAVTLQELGFAGRDRPRRRLPGLARRRAADGSGRRGAAALRDHAVSAAAISSKAAT